LNLDFLHLALHVVKSGTILEPVDLEVVEGMVKGEGVGGTVVVSHSAGNLAEGSELGDAGESDLVIGADLVVVSGVSEGKWEHTLLLEVSLVDSSEGLDDDGSSSKMSGLKSGVFSGRTFTIVVVTDNNPWDSSGLVLSGDVWNASSFASSPVADVVHLVVLRVKTGDQEVVGDVVEVTSELEPWASGGDVIGGAFAFDLDKDLGVFEVLSVPFVEGSQELKSIRLGVDDDFTGAFSWWVSVVVLASFPSFAGELVTVWGLKLELGSIGSSELINFGVEVEGTGDGVNSSEFWRGNETVSHWVGVVSSSEVSVEGSDDGVLLALLSVFSVPLANAWTARVGHDNTADALEDLGVTVSLDGSSDLFGTRGDGESSLASHASVSNLLCEGSGSAHIFVRRVGARTDQAVFDLNGPVILASGLTDLRCEMVKIWGEGTVDTGFKLIEVDVDVLVVFGTGVSGEKTLVGVGKLTDGRSAGGVQVRSHSVVVWEHGGSGTDFSTHVADGGHTSARHRLNTGSEVLDNGTSTTLDGEDVSDLENDVLGGSPSRKLSSELDTDNLGTLEFPWDASHDIDGISATNTDAAATETTTVGSVGIGTDEHNAGEGVVLKDDLVNNTRASLPEADAVLFTSRAEEIVDFSVECVGDLKISDGTVLGGDQVIGVDGRGNSDAGHARGDELEHGHLSGGVLHGDAVGSEVEVRLASSNVGFGSVVQMTVDDLLGESKRSVKTALDNVDVLCETFVVDWRIVES